MSVASSRVWLGMLLYTLAACEDTSGGPDGPRSPADGASASGEEAGARAGDASVDGGAGDAGLDARVVESLDAARDGASDGAAPDARASDAGSGATDAAPPATCSVRAPTECPTPMPTYADVAPIFSARCAVCHGASWTGQWPLDTYRHVVDWEDSIRTHLLECTMPPADAGVPMSDAERMQILNWIRCDTPQ